MSTQIDLGPVLPISKGDWNANTQYERLNTVRYNSAAWVCRVASSLGVEPSEESTDWYLQVKDTSAVTSVNGQRGDVVISTAETPALDADNTRIATTEWVKDVTLSKIDTDFQVVPSDLAVGIGKSFYGVKQDASSVALLGIEETSENDVVSSEVVIGNSTEPLKLRTGASTEHGSYIVVETSEGVKELSYRDEVINDVAANFLVGFCLPCASQVIPSQCKRAIGNIYNVADFPEAGAALGSKYGGDGVTNFGTPDLRNAEPTNLSWVIVLGKDQGAATRLYCGREGIYCGLENLHPGMEVTV